MVRISLKVRGIKKGFQFKRENFTNGKVKGREKTFQEQLKLMWKNERIRDNGLDTNFIPEIELLLKVSLLS